MKVFLKSIVLFFEQNKYTDIRRFKQFFVTKQEFLASKKLKQYRFMSTMAIQHIFNKSRILSVFTENTQIYILFKIFDIFKIKL